MANTSCSEGSFCRVDADDPSVVRAAKAAVGVYNDKLGFSRALGFIYLVKVTSAEKQVVAGWNYKLQFKAAKFMPRSIEEDITCTALVSVSLTNILSVKHVRCKSCHSLV